MAFNEWTAVAEHDDALVADLLLKIKNSGDRWMTTSASRSVSTSVSSFGVFKGIGWGMKGRRSSRKERATRSPTNVLSWSGGGGGTSVSGSGNAHGEASSVICCRSSGFRSKDTPANDLANSKGLKRKKTYIELKEEELSLLQQRQILERELAILHATLLDHRTTNKNLKRIKRMSVQCRNTTVPVEEHQFISAPMKAKTFLAQGILNREMRPPTPPHNSFSFSVAKDKDSFVLPDLNMLPAIEEEYS